MLEVAGEENDESITDGLNVLVSLLASEEKSQLSAILDVPANIGIINACQATRWAASIRVSMPAIERLRVSLAQ